MVHIRPYLVLLMVLCLCCTIKSDSRTEIPDIPTRKWVFEKLANLNGPLANLNGPLANLNEPLAVRGSHTLRLLRGNKILHLEEFPILDANIPRHSNNCDDNHCHHSVVFGNKTAEAKKLFYGSYRNDEPLQQQIEDQFYIDTWPLHDYKGNIRPIISYIAVHDNNYKTSRIYNDIIMIIEGGIGKTNFRMIILSRQQNRYYDYRVSIYYDPK